MRIWALADLHLSISCPEKDMRAFGKQWAGYIEKIEENWTKLVQADDLVLLPGDISWAMKVHEAKTDLEWIEGLPGTKVMIRGNHDYWWASLSKMNALGLQSLNYIQNSTFIWNGIEVTGTRLWDSPEYGFMNVIEIRGKGPRVLSEEELNKSRKTFEKELERLEGVLKKLGPKRGIRIVMTHYPPIGLDLAPSRVSEILERYEVDHCYFGHLHNVRKGEAPFGTARGVHYSLVSADYVDFTPQKVLDLS